VSLRQRTKAELADGTTVESTYDGRDLRGWEKKHRRSALAEPMSLSMLTWLAWSSGKREGVLNGAYEKYEDFDEQCVWVEGLNDEDDEAEGTQDPTEATSQSPTPTSPGDVS
jgi:hypothetical protein